mmetsp:Transcript_27333/g.67850  ORF Transcript_27333/g.67850 Transcript_27333/m.67850 type:complete len:239 (+) Transcript_27333:1905-2621(+)
MRKTALLNLRTTGSNPDNSLRFCIVSGRMATRTGDLLWCARTMSHQGTPYRWSLSSPTVTSRQASHSSSFALLVCTKVAGAISFFWPPSLYSATVARTLSCSRPSDEATIKSHRKRRTKQMLPTASAFAIRATVLLPQNSPREASGHLWKKWGNLPAIASHHSHSTRSTCATCLSEVMMATGLYYPQTWMPVGFNARLATNGGIGCVACTTINSISTAGHTIAWTAAIWSQQLGYLRI